MKDSHSEQRIKKAMKMHEIASTDAQDLKQCKKDLMQRLAMDKDEAEDVALSIREHFLPKLLESEGIEVEEMLSDLNGKMTDDDENFEDESPEEMHDEDHDEDTPDDDDEVDEDEIATIHITVPADKIRDVEEALEAVLGDMDADSKDQATDHDTNDNGDKRMNIEARKELRKTILAAMAEDSEVEHVSRKNGFEHAKDEQTFEEDFHKTQKGNLTDSEFDTLDYAENEIPTFTDLISKIKGLEESLKETKFDGTPEDADAYALEFDPLEIPSQGDEGLYHEVVVPSEGKLPRKRTVNSSTLGEFDEEAAEEALAFALKTAGVSDEDMGKLTYAEALDLFKAIKTANKLAEMHDDEDHEDRAEYHAEKENKEDHYATMLRNLMRGDKEHEAELSIKTPEGVTIDTAKKHDEAAMEKEAELYRARLKTAYAMSTKLATAGILPANDVDSYAEGMLSDGLTVTAMIRQTKLMLTTAAANAEKFASASSNGKKATASISFNPAVRVASADLSGASDIQSALRNIGWTTPEVRTGMED